MDQSLDAIINIIASKMPLPNTSGTRWRVELDPSGTQTAAAGDHHYQSEENHSATAAGSGFEARPAPRTSTTEVARVPLGSFVHARSGDKGGDANLGLWVSAADPRAAERASWLLSVVTPDWVRGLLPEAAELEVDVVPLPNLHGVNVVIHDLLGLEDRMAPKFVRRYASLRADGVAALATYAEDVRTGVFPSEAETYHVSEDVADELKLYA